MAVVCAVHCLALPVLAGAACCTEESLLGHPLVEGSMLGLTALVGYGTLGFAFQRHRKPLPLGLLTLGLGGMILSHFAFSGPFATAATVAGALTVVAGQWVNRRLKEGSCPATCCAEETVAAEGAEACQAAAS